MNTGKKENKQKKAAKTPQQVFGVQSLNINKELLVYMKEFTVTEKQTQRGRS